MTQYFSSRLNWSQLTSCGKHIVPHTRTKTGAFPACIGECQTSLNVYSPIKPFVKTVTQCIRRLNYNNYKSTPAQFHGTRHEFPFITCCVHCSLSRSKQCTQRPEHYYIGQHSSGVPAQHNDITFLSMKITVKSIFVTKRQITAWTSVVPHVCCNKNKILNSFFPKIKIHSVASMCPVNWRLFSLAVVKLINI